MITKYVVGWSKDNIETVEVLRETEKCVFTASGNSERRHNKISDWARYYDSWSDAYDYLIKQVENSVSAAESKFKIECDRRVKIESLRDPSK